jgi:hypothetical protein
MQSDSFSASLCSELARLSSTIYERCAKKASPLGRANKFLLHYFTQASQSAERTNCLSRLAGYRRSYSQAKRKLLTSVSEVTYTRDRNGSPVRFNLQSDRFPVIPFPLPQGREGLGLPSPPRGRDALRAERGLWSGVLLVYI